MDTTNTDYKTDARGNLIHITNIKEIDLMRDDLVAEIVAKTQAMQIQMRQLKRAVFDDIAAFVTLSAEKYGAHLGGKKGNVTLNSFNGQYKVQFAMAEHLSFDERIIAAKALIDECINDWARDSKHELRALINQAFDVDKQGNLSTTKILGLRRVKIDDERWLRAMDAISDSIQVVGSKAYVRVYERVADTEQYRQISLDFASV